MGKHGRPPPRRAAAFLFSSRIVLTTINTSVISNVKIPGILLPLGAAEEVG
jgi:hypothetical protein